MPKKNIKISEKQEKYVEQYLPYGMMIGVTVGFIASMNFDDFTYMIYGICGGLLLGVVGGLIAAKTKKKK